MRYVAFLDILGFKSLLKSLSQRDAKDYIADFSAVVYSIFHKYNPDLITGFIVSDSLVLHTNNVDPEALEELVKLVIEICQREFSINSILMRGAIAKGDFDRMPAVELPKLQKQLMVGQAYVDAYTMESSTKTIGVLLSKEVYEDLQEYELSSDLLEETIDKNIYYFMRYLSIDYLLDQNNIRKFIKLASKSEWLPHYYNAIYISLKNEKNEKKVFQVFDNIISVLREDGNNWRLIDTFIENTFSENVYPRYQQRFSKYLRKRLIKATDNISKNHIAFEYKLGYE